MSPQLKREEVALVTGAAGGIGTEIVRALVANGTPVALLDRKDSAVQTLSDDFEAAGARTIALPVDVTSTSEVEAALAEAEAELGPIGYLANTAGILRSGTATELSDEDWDTTFAVNAGGVFRVSRAVAARMVPRGRGAIVTVASNAAGTARAAMSAYAASKAAASAFTKCLGLELATHGIRCNVVAPGSTATTMLTGMYSHGEAERASITGVPGAFRLGIPLGKIAAPADIADAVLFLLSERASHITMHELTVDGGATLGV